MASFCDEPCDDVDEFAAAFSGLVLHIGADPKAKDAARVMRLAGTLSFPKTKRKLDAGYQIELTTLAVNERAQPSSIEALAALPSRDPAESARNGLPGRGRPRQPPRPTKLSGTPGGE